MGDIENFVRLKENVEQKRQEISRAEGALEQELKRLKDFDCKTLDDAKELLDQLFKQTDEQKEAFEKAFKKFKDKYEDKL